MSFATSMQSTASRLLTKYGRAVTCGRVVEGAYNTATSAVAAGTTTSYSGVGHPSPYDQADIDGTTIQAGDIELLFYTTSVPAIGDTATIDTLVYRVMNVKKLNAQGLNIVYKLQLRV